ncbi:MAG TPA: hypothetical protein VFQ53_20995 [Kofleriaceae bacterium]|nr:hypothetical protein [Kofleriaceae bacterium]
MKALIGLAAVIVFSGCQQEPRDPLFWNQAEGNHFKWIPAGIARGVDPCTRETRIEWVPAFEMLEFPILAGDLIDWEHEQDRSDFGSKDYRGGPFGLGLVEARSKTAALLCRDFGMSVPTVPELWRAMRGSSPQFEWGNRWIEQPVCPVGSWGAEDLCIWISRRGVVSPLYAHHPLKWGESVELEHCPHRYDAYDVTTSELCELPLAMIRCVRRRDRP